MKLLSLSSTIVLLAAAFAVPAASAQDNDAASMAARLDGVLDTPVTEMTLRRVATDRAIPVIVILDDTSLVASGVAQPTAMELEQRRAALSGMRDRLLSVAGRATGRRFGEAGASIAQEGGAERVLRQYSITPGFAMTARPDTLEALRAQPDVVAIYEDVPSRPATNDTSVLIGADDVWGEGYRGTDVAVAILDSGVELEHPMTGPAITASACFNTTLEGEASSLCPDGTDEMTQLDGGEAGDSCLEDDIAVAPEEGTDGCFHGTHVGGIAAGRLVTLSGGDQPVGMARGANIVAVNVFSRVVAAECEEDGSAEEPCIRSYGVDQLAALEWLYNNREALGLASVNMSLGGGEYTQACPSNGLRPVIAVLRDAGIATAISSGNDRYLDAIGGPACISEAVSVGSTTKNDEISGFSNSSELVDLLAPGSSILSAWQSEEPADGDNCIIQDSEPNSEGFCHWFATSSGTSMASPHVAGAFALLRDAFPDATVDEMEAALRFSGVQVTDPDNGITRSRIQVDAAYNLLSDGGAVVAGVEVTPLEAYRVSGQSGDPDSFATKSYVLRNTTASSRTVRIDSYPAWIETSSAVTIPAQSERTLTLSVDMTGLPESADSGYVTLSNNSDGPVDIPVSIQVERTTETAELGPFDWTGDASAYTASVFRIAGLNAGAPTRIRASIANAAEAGYAGDFGDCTINVRDARYNGAEYLITSSDLADCGDFRRADITFEIQADAADIVSGIRMRRFAINSAGGVTDFSFDSEGQSVSAASGVDVAVDLGLAANSFVRLEAESVWQAASGVTAQGSGEPLATAATEFGPFEWTGDAFASTGSAFRITGLDTAAPTAIDVAIDNATAGGFAGAYSDCSLTVSAARYQGNEYVIAQSDLSDCGRFVRGDLRFRVTADTADSGQLAMRRFAITRSGGLTDFAFDSEDGQLTSLASISDTLGQLVFGPFEWTGDANASTSSVFRIVGFDGVLPTRIDIAIDSPLRGDYNGNFSDCRLALDPARLRGREFLIFQSDLADCGSFGRADLRFRIRAEKTAAPDGLAMRRFAVGARGDITDFAFDSTPAANARSVALPDGASPGMAAVEFGPFEWAGDANAPTRAVFRIAGLSSGPPERIDVALDNAYSDGFTGTYDDCSLQVRASRSGNGEFVVGASDLADCGSFGRADVSFRIVAAQDDVDDGLIMRRFAVTSGGGLTDFGFDAEASGE